MKTPTISAVVPVYNGEAYVAETLAAILSQTRPPDEVLVVDDGSTDGTQDELARFRADIRVVKQANRGVAGAMNRCFDEARSSYVAKCDADDIWAPDKLEQQEAAVRAHCEIDVAFCAARVFGTAPDEGANTDSLGWHRLPFVGMPTNQNPSAGVMDRREFGRTLFRSNPILPSATLVRHSLFLQVGPFRERRCEDYDFWMRALGEGAVFYYDPKMLVNYRRHDENSSSDFLTMLEANHEEHLLHADLVDDRRLVRAVCAGDQFRMGRIHVDRGRPKHARRAFIRSLRYGSTVMTPENARALMWVVILSLPAGARARVGVALVRGSRGIDILLGIRQAAPP